MDTTWNLYVQSASFRNGEVEDWAKPIDLTLYRAGPLEVKLTQSVRMVEHSLGAVFWTQANFLG